MCSEGERRGKGEVCSDEAKRLHAGLKRNEVNVRITMVLYRQLRLRADDSEILKGLGNNYIRKGVLQTDFIASNRTISTKILISLGSCNCLQAAISMNRIQRTRSSVRETGEALRVALEIASNFGLRSASISSLLIPS